MQNQQQQHLRRRRNNYMKIKELGIDGKDVGNIEVSDSVFSLKPRKDLIKMVVDWQISRHTKKTGYTKTRGEVAGSRKKIGPQKGSGGARHGNITAPIFVGGGIAHGPKAKGKHRVKRLNKKVRKLGLKHALSSKVLDNKINILSDKDFKNFKTKDFSKFLSTINSKSALIIYDKENEVLLNNVKNIKNIKNIPEIGTNVYDVLKYQNVLFTHSSIKKLQERLLK
jgi:large subunit ribosomal protein L4